MCMDQGLFVTSLRYWSSLSVLGRHVLILVCSLAELIRCPRYPRNYPSPRESAIWSAISAARTSLRPGWPTPPSRPSKRRRCSTSTSATSTRSPPAPGRRTPKGPRSRGGPSPSCRRGCLPPRRPTPLSRPRDPPRRPSCPPTVRPRPRAPPGGRRRRRTTRPTPGERCVYTADAEYLLDLTTREKISQIWKCCA